MLKVTNYILERLPGVFGAGGLEIRAIAATCRLLARFSEDDRRHHPPATQILCNLGAALFQTHRVAFVDLFYDAVQLILGEQRRATLKNW